MQVRSSPKDVAEESEIIITGIITHGHILSIICRQYKSSQIARTLIRILKATMSRNVGLPHPKNVYDAFCGENGIFEGLKPGTVWIDHSTTDYAKEKITANT